jgi:hypothetical protein
VIEPQKVRDLIKLLLSHCKCVCIFCHNLSYFIVTGEVLNLFQQDQAHASHG